MIKDYFKEIVNILNLYVLILAIMTLFVTMKSCDIYEKPEVTISKPIYLYNFYNIKFIYIMFINQFFNNECKIMKRYYTYKIAKK